MTNRRSPGNEPDRRQAKPLLTANEVARRFRTNRGSIYNWAAAGKLPFIKIFGALRFDPNVIEKIAKEGTVRAR
ncbi:MAG: helix-turn-helix domain-containing protein [Acidobacteria bacterium]|nr:helix-turn-helix domain-containing protein [Acidobacteriota bacterium]